MSPAVSVVIGLLAGIVAIVLLYVKVLPKNVDGKLNNKFLQFLHDYFHFKKLYIEAVLKFLFTVLSVLSVTMGFFLLFAHVNYGWGYSQSFFGYGLLLLVVGPISLRITYELLMMTILLVQNVIDINNKMKAPKCEQSVPVVTQVTAESEVVAAPQIAVESEVAVASQEQITE